MPAEKRIHVVGLGVAPWHVTPHISGLIEGADCLVGGRRHLATWGGRGQLEIPITGDLAGLRREMEGALAQGLEIAVLATGDPLFHGIGNRILEWFGSKRVSIHPNVSVPQYAFSRIGLPLHKAHICSLHGARGPSALSSSLLTALGHSPLIGIFTDPRNGPDRVAQFLVGCGLESVEMWICQQLGSDQERIERTTADRCHGPFASPNFVVLRLPEATTLPPDPLTGLPDDSYATRNGMVTKAEVRAVTLSKLHLRRGERLWDIGAGSGSVSIEAARLLYPGEVYAIERSRKMVQFLQENRRESGLPNLHVVHGTAPACLRRLPLPDRIFIGGGGADLGEILRFCLHLEPVPRRVVMTAVLLDTLWHGLEILGDCQWRWEVVHLQVSRGKKIADGIMLAPINPVWIVAAEPNHG